MIAGLTPDRIAELYATGQLLMLAVVRPLGFAVFFTAFAWGQINSGLLRIAFSFALALPVMAPLWSIARPTIDVLPAPIVLLVAKELFLGFVIGFILSLPFEAFNVAGAIIDNVRGSGSPLPTPGGEMTPYAQGFVAVALWLFAALGGFWLVTDVIYASYATWPLLATLPPLTHEGLMGFFGFLARLARLAMVVAGPIVLLMLAVDLVFGVAGKIGKQLNVNDLSLAVKSLVAALCLPVFAMVFVRLVTGEVRGLGALESLIRAAIR